ncbi:MAG: DUF2794 domain-containing protein [Kordiimonadaceae bacterium]|jgi:hypothetical protein|nr:DUF2794 domain-containing protein [Kordiimonadaceae bacterium]MBT6034960.1 DUF2794 domain-containing protein [Kordiimonadaceae bacterium]MBT6328472.1 DUF2794 domain-containing protein [Kordiimonadaceae bacterium]MBT7582794.1 DUF2794 domain-containing protein [Kordiimonadaceae bacterium]
MTDQSTIIPFQNAARKGLAQHSTFFERGEFEAILNIYGKMVASGYWKDYAISGSRDMATFAVHQKASERPVFRITKTPALRNKQGAYAIHSSQGQILKRGHELAQVLKYFEKKLIKLVQ